MQDVHYHRARADGRGLAAGVINRYFFTQKNRLKSIILITRHGMSCLHFQFGLINHTDRDLYLKGATVHI